MRNSNKHKKLWFICPTHCVSMVPSVYGCIKWLADRDFKIELFLYHPTNIPLPEFNTPNVKLHVIFYNTNRSWRRISRIIINWFIFVTKNIARRPDYIIAADHWGLLLAGLYIWSSYSKVIYFNLELRLKREMAKYGKKLFKMAEVWLNRRCIATIIQDRYRAEALTNEHKLENHKFIILPNSSLGYAEHVDSLWLQKNYNIPADKIILLYVGSIISHFMCLEIAKAAKEFSKDINLVFHSPHNVETQYRKSLCHALTERNSGDIISNHFLDYDELKLLIMSAHIGIGLCRPEKGNELNEELMGMSSGKIALYLQCGIPVIISNYTSLKWVEDNGCGICIDDVDEINVAVDKIMEDYDGFRKRAITTFDKVLSLNSGLEQLKDILDVPK